MLNINYATLREKGACKEQLYKFKELFGESVIPTPYLCVEHALTFDWDWAASLLTPPQQKIYGEACAAARKKHVEARDAARKKYVVEARSPAWKTYVEACAAAQKIYAEACAAAWFEAWSSQC